MPRTLAFVVLVALCARAAAAEDRARLEAVRQRSGWLLAAGAVVAAGGASLLGLGLLDHGEAPGSAVYERGTHEIVGGAAVLAFGIQVGLLALLGAFWPLTPVLLPTPGGGGSVALAGAWP